MMGPDVMTIHQALDDYRKWVDTPQVALLPEPPGFDDALTRLMGMASAPLAAHWWTDLCFAATAEAAGLPMSRSTATLSALGWSAAWFCRVSDPTETEI